MGESEEVSKRGLMGESEGVSNVSKGGLMGESEERGSFRLVLGEGIVSVLELCSSVLIINPTRTLECFFCSSEHGGWKVWKAQ